VVQIVIMLFVHYNWIGRCLRVCDGHLHILAVVGCGIL